MPLRILLLLSLLGACAHRPKTETMTSASTCVQKVRWDELRLLKDLSPNQSKVKLRYRILQDNLVTAEGELTFHDRDLGNSILLRGKLKRASKEKNFQLEIREDDQQPKIYKLSLKDDKIKRSLASIWPHRRETYYQEPFVLKASFFEECKEGEKVSLQGLMEDRKWLIQQDLQEMVREWSPAASNHWIMGKKEAKSWDLVIGTIKLQLPSSYSATDIYKRPNRWGSLWTVRSNTQEEFSILIIKKENALEQLKNLEKRSYSMSTSLLIVFEEIEDLSFEDYKELYEYFQFIDPFFLEQRLPGQLLWIPHPNTGFQLP